MKMEALDLDEMGYNYRIGSDYARVTFRMYNKVLNKNEYTKSVFKYQTVAANSILSKPHLFMVPLDIKQTHSILDAINLNANNKIERNEELTVIDEALGINFKWKYTETDTLNSPFREGGYVIDFDANKRAKGDQWKNATFE